MARDISREGNGRFARTFTPAVPPASSDVPVSAPPSSSGARPGSSAAPAYGEMLAHLHAVQAATPSSGDVSAVPRWTIRDLDGVRPLRTGRPLTADESLTLMKDGEFEGAEVVTASGDTVQVWVSRDTGTQICLKDGKLHSVDDSPAMICPDGTRMWYERGSLHRQGGKPAIVTPDGTRYWFEHGVPQAAQQPGGPLTHREVSVPNRLLLWFARMRNVSRIAS